MKEKLKLLIKNMAAIITFLVFAVSIFLLFETVGFRKEIDEAFWNRFLVNLFFQLFMIALWLPDGKKRGALDDTFLSNKDILDRKMELASKPENYNKIERWCKYATEENRKLIIKNKLAKVGILYHIYEQRKDDSKWRAEQTPKAQKTMKWLDTHIVRVKEIKATEFISNSSIKLMYDIANKETFATGLKVGVKVIISVVMSIITALILFNRKEFSIAALADLGFWTITILGTIYFSLRTGRELVTVVRQDFIIRNIAFLDSCDSWLMMNGENPITQITK